MIFLIILPKSFAYFTKKKITSFLGLMVTGNQNLATSIIACRQNAYLDIIHLLNQEISFLLKIYHANRKTMKTINQTTA